MIVVSPAPSLAAETLQGLDDYILMAMEEWNVPGLSIAILKDGIVVHTRGYGVTQIHGKQATDSQTLFPLASVTKDFTASAIGLLVQEGKLDWNDPVIKHLPDLEFSDPYRTQHVTIADLLSHRTGLERGDLLPRRGDVSVEEIVNRVRFLQPTYGFREKWEYNNLMYYVAGEIVETVSGRTWKEFIHERLLNPTNMNSTLTAPDRNLSNQAVLHLLVESEVVPIESTQKWKSDPSPAGSMVSNADDMALWLLACLPSDEKQTLLDPQTKRVMQAIHMSVPATWDRSGNPYAAKFYGWGFGWSVLDYEGRKICYHAGSSGAILAIMPEEQLGVIIMCNLDRSGLPGMLMYDVFDAYIKTPDEAWDKTKWEFWKKHESNEDQNRQQKLTEVKSKRKLETQPSLPLSSLTGEYTTDLYGNLIVQMIDQQLTVKFGANPEVAVEHWENDTFYVRKPVEDDPYVDWLMEFLIEDGQPHGLKIQRIGWHEPLPIFRRVNSESSKP